MDHARSAGALLVRASSESRGTCVRPPQKFLFSASDLTPDSTTLLRQSTLFIRLNLIHTHSLAAQGVVHSLLHHSRSHSLFVIKLVRTVSASLATLLQHKASQHRTLIQPHHQINSHQASYFRLRHRSPVSRVI